ncbi:GNAT family N-acetyltransferase [Sphaerotilus sp.]|uniref:GNAT family N-acetyltransferase n=1 Tax=Sphaerotilus sp. TaxID=2093942 RepID=UPI0034E249F5
MTEPTALVILNLTDRPQDVPCIARWFYEQWGHQVPGNSVEQTMDRVRGKLNHEQAPLFLVAVDADCVQGVIALKLHERPEFPDRTHWLGDLYVAPDVRGQGVGSRLIKALVVKARALGVSQLWLQTANRQPLYARLGWRETGQVLAGTQAVSVMVLDLGALSTVRIESERVLLVPIHAGFRTVIFETFTARITRYMHPKPSDTVEEMGRFVSDSVAGLAAATNLQMVILSRSDEVFLGCIGLHGLDRPDPEMGLWLKEAVHGRGLGREAAGALIAWARAQGRFECVRYPVDRRNLASRKIPEAHGGVIAREFREVSGSGFELDLIEYRIPCL